MYEMWLVMFYNRVSKRPVLTRLELWEMWQNGVTVLDAVAEEHRLAREYDRENFDDRG